MKHLDPKAYSTPTPRLWQSALLVTALSMTSGLALAQDGGFQNSGAVIGDEVMYSIGGGNAVSMSGAAGMRSIGAGVGWNSNLICGDMNISTTIQRADPGLYNLLTNGILQARLDFDRSKLTCRAMAERMADTAGGQLGWSQIAEGMALRQAVSSTDAVSAIEQAEKNRGNDGVPWVGGDNAGGVGQHSIKVVGDVTRAGYNLVNGRNVADTSSIDTANCQSLSCQTWASPQQAIDFATRVLGEQEQRTCEGCIRTETVPGVGLTPVIQEEYDTKLKVLQELVRGTRNTTFENLHEAGSTSLPITRGVIEALRDEPDQDILARRLASEVALASVLEKALLLQRTLLTGQKEPNVAANQLAVAAVTQESNTLDREILNLKTELELRRELASNSPMAIIQRHSVRSAGSRGIYEGDPVPNRLDQLQRRNPGDTP
ncbi:integrating conjugative element protein [Dickeya chrysanthemi]|uniref:integrating conjugative element protein n=1 Tax=Dickeya chrysanthemi TaxID=556 RepID=UPI003AFB783E